MLAAHQHLQACLTSAAQGAGMGAMRLPQRAFSKHVNASGVCLPRRRRGPLARQAYTANIAAPAPPAPLPPPPEKASLIKVLPYLTKLACGEPRMALRLCAALTALFVAKGSGAPPARLRLFPIFRYVILCAFQGDFCLV